MYFKRSNQIAYIKPPIEYFLGEYNSLLASILVENIDSFAYIASAVINRMEAQTHSYEKIEKYIQLQDLLNKDSNLGITVVEEDEILFGLLKRKYNSRVRREKKHIVSFLSRIKKYIKRIDLVNFVLRLVTFFRQTLNLILVSYRLRIPKKEYTSVIRSYFDFRCKDGNGRLREEYFGPLAIDLAKEGNLLVIYKLLHPEDLGSYLKLRKEQPDFDSCLIESFLDPFLLVKSLFLFIFSKIRLEKKYFYRDRDITGLLQKMINRDYYSLSGIEVFMEYKIAKKILSLNPKKLYLPFENQTWEKVYPLVKNKIGAKGTRIIGFQHSGLSYKLIMHFPTEIEKNLPLFPDKILTVGGIYKRLLREKAHYPCEIAEGAALRHAKYVVNGSFNIRVPHKVLKKKIGYAFSYDLAKYRIIFEALLGVFKDSEIGVYLKIHPDYNENYVMRSLKVDLPKNMILAQKIPWPDVYSSVDCVLYDDNSIGIEGIINGVKTFMLDAGEPIYDCGRMFYFNEWETTINKDGLLRLKDDIENNIFNPWYDLDKINEYLNSYYNAYSKEKYFTAYS